MERQCDGTGKPVKLGGETNPFGERNREDETPQQEEGKKRESVKIQ